LSLHLHFHPLASFCHKVLIALYENATPFEPHIVDLGDAASSAAFKALWPMGKMPVLRDEAHGLTIPESTIIIEYLAQRYPGPAQLVPADPELGREARLWDRIYDHYVHEPMQKIVTDRLRPAGRNDPFGVEAARATLRAAYAMIDGRMATRRWAVGEGFGMADCAAAPALFYAAKVEPFGAGQPHLAAYFERLLARPSYARALREAEPYFKLFPG
jgi:glutathione S-transferase